MSYTSAFTATTDRDICHEKRSGVFDTGGGSTTPKSPLIPPCHPGHVLWMISVCVWGFYTVCFLSDSSSVTGVGVKTHLSLKKTKVFLYQN